MILKTLLTGQTYGLCQVDVEKFVVYNTVPEDMLYTLYYNRSCRETSTNQRDG